MSLIPLGVSKAPQSATDCIKPVLCDDDNFSVKTSV